MRMQDRALQLARQVDELSAELSSARLQADDRDSATLRAKTASSDAAQLRRQLRVLQEQLDASEAKASQAAADLDVEARAGAAARARAEVAELALQAAKREAADKAVELSGAEARTVLEGNRAEAAERRQSDLLRLVETAYQELFAVDCFLRDANSTPPPAPAFDPFSSRQQLPAVAGAVKQALTAAASACSQSDAEARSAADAASQTRAENASLSSRLAAAERELARVQSRADAAESTVQRTLDALQSAEARADGEAGAAAHLRGQLEVGESASRQAVTEITALRDRVSDAESRLQDARDSLSEAEARAADLGSQVDALTREQQSDRSALRSAVAEAAALTQQVAHFRQAAAEDASRAEALFRDVTGLRASLARAVSDAQAASERVARLEREVEERAAVAAQAQTEAAEANASARKAVATKTEADTELDLLRANLAEVERRALSEIESAKTTVATQNARVADLTSQLARVQGQYRTAHSHAEASAAEVEAAARDRSDALRAARVLYRQLTALRGSHQREQTRNEALAAQVSGLISESESAGAANSRALDAIAASLTPTALSAAVKDLAPPNDAETRSLRKQVHALRAQLPGPTGTMAPSVDSARAVEMGERLLRVLTSASVLPTAGDYPLPPNPDALDVAVQRVLVDLRCPVLISLRKVAPETYVADRRLRLRLVNERVVVRQGGGAMSLERYLRELYEIFFAEPGRDEESEAEGDGATPPPVAGPDAECPLAPHDVLDERLEFDDWLPDPEPAPERARPAREASGPRPQSAPRHQPDSERQMPHQRRDARSQAAPAPRTSALSASASFSATQPRTMARPASSHRPISVPRLNQTRASSRGGSRTARPQEMSAAYILALHENARRSALHQ
jgi:hypothetical protein